MSANCEYYESLMSRMLDGDLLNAESDALRDHIRTCKSCRTLCIAFCGMTLSLRRDLADAPAELSGSVMSRIRTWEAEQALEADEPMEDPVPLSRERRVSPKKRWMPTVIAACLVLVIGVGAASALVQSGKKSADTADMAAYSRTAETESNAAEAPAAMAESAAFDMAKAAAEEGEAEAAEPMEAAPEAALGTAQGYTLSDPAFVPEGLEADFEALLSDAGSLPETSLHVFFYVEHRGVIYEFMTDENEEYLLWRDAAEGFPTLSQGSFDDLWAIFK